MTVLLFIPAFTSQTERVENTRRIGIAHKSYFPNNAFNLFDLLSNQSIQIKRNYDDNKLNEFINKLDFIRSKGNWSKNDILELYFSLLPDFSHKETGKYLDQKM